MSELDKKLKEWFDIPEGWGFQAEKSKRFHNEIHGLQKQIAKKTINLNKVKKKLASKLLRGPEFDK